LKFSFHFRRTFEDVFEGATGGHGWGIGLGIGCFEKLPVCSSSEFDPYREKVAEEMLLCEVIVQRGYGKAL
jgi:hypothetical protein